VIELTIPTREAAWRYLEERLGPYRIDLAVIAALTVLAAVLRVVVLQDVPPGLHGDEAWTGIDARRVLDEGWIGPYVPSALGQPTGPLYFAAAFIKVFGDTYFAIRFSMAVLGIVTIPVAYLTFRVMFERPLAAFGALLLALSLWHLHYSRIAFMVISAPLIELLTLLFLFLGMKTGRWLPYALAGLAFGAGIYTYNAYPIFALPLAVLLVAAGLTKRGPELRAYAQRVALTIGLAVIVALPLITYAADLDHNYLSHHRTVSLLETPEWKEGGLFDKAGILADETRDFAGAVLWTGERDYADGAGERAMLDRLSVVLLVMGLAVFVWQWRRTAHLAVLLMVALLPLGTILTTQGTFRQTLGMTPFLAVLEAAPLAFWWGLARSLPAEWRNVSYAAMALLVAGVAFINLSFYFGEFKDTPLTQFTFGPELTAASLYLRDLPGDPYIYFYSGRWSLKYETPRYLAPNRSGEDRSNEFGRFDLAPDRARDVVYVFLAPYEAEADQVRRRYPGGTLVERTREDGSFLFRAYELPSARPAAPPPPGGPVPTPAPTQRPSGGDERDAVRQGDLAAIQEALEAYRAEHGSYPSNEGGIQTLCVFIDIDAGCALRDVLEPIPLDPLGQPYNENGYWYSSDGVRYTVYAQREGEELAECAEHPDHLARLDSVYCVRGGGPQP
jgi:4-amino-4-deoxy-L-arabinose transferase-like glycosyltransferase